MAAGRPPTDGAPSLDAPGSRVLLVGTGDHGPESGLPRVDAVVATLADLRQAMLQRCGLPADRVRVIVDPTGPSELGTALAEEAERAQDVLLLYYVGHGLLSPGGELYLATRRTDPRPTRLAHSALAYAAVRDALLQSAARAIVVVLDCCFSGRAVGTLGDPEDAAVALAQVSGGFVLAAAARDELALTPPGARHTAFSGALLRLLTSGDPEGPPELTLDHVARYLARELPAAGLPRPRHQASGGVEGLVLAPNPAHRPAAEERVGPEPAPAAGGPAPDVCPYPGLAAFGTEDARWFFGRERAVAELVGLLTERLSIPGPLAVVAPSGAGKSSLLRAGLVPALARGVLPVPGSRTWPVLLFTPTAHPARELATQVASLTGTPPQRDAPLADPVGFGATVRAALQTRAGGGDVSRARVVLVVDQFEETFTECADEAERSAFVRALAAAAGPDGAAPPAALVVLGLRADRYGQCAAYPELASALQSGQVLLGSMDAGELRDAILRPAQAAGLTMEPGLVELLLRDVGTLQVPLPMLAHALLATWQQRSDDTLTVAGYGHTGGISGAIAATAERVYARLDEAAREAVRPLLLAMVRAGSEVEDTRRRVDRAALLRDQPDPAAAASALESLARARLVVLDERTAEIAHEALLTAWPRLRGWLDLDRAGLLTHQQLAEAAEAWDREGRHPSALHRGPRLAATRAWLEGAPRGPVLSPVEREFLDESTRREEHEQRAARRQRNRLRGLAGALAVLLVLTATAAGLALQAREQAVGQTQLALSRQLAAQATIARTGDPRQAALLALAAWRTSQTEQARSSLLSVPIDGYAGELRGSAGPAIAIAFSPDGRLTATGDDQAVRLWDATSHRQLASMVQPGGSVAGVAFSPDGHTLASAAIGAGAHLWDVSSHRQVAALANTAQAVAFSPNGGLLAVAHANAVELWDVKSAAQVAILGSHQGPAWAVAFSPDGHTLASSGQDGTVRLWSVDARGPLAVLTGHTAAVFGLAFSPDGRTVASASTDTTVRLWDVARRAGAATLTTPDSVLSGVAFSPDGAQIVAAGVGGPYFWDAATQAYRGALDAGSVANPHAVKAIAFRPDGHLLAAAELDGPVRLRTISYFGLTTRNTASGVAFSPTGPTIAVTSLDDTLRLWDTATRNQRVLAAGAGGLDSVAFSPDGRMVVAGGRDDSVHVWDPSTGALLATVPLGTCSPSDRQTVVRTVDFSRDGSLLAVATLPREATPTDNCHFAAQLWDVRSWRLRAQLPTEAGVGTALRFSPDGSLVAIVPGSGNVQLWDVRMGRVVATLRAPPNRTGTTLGIAFRPDGRILAIVVDTNVLLWDVVSRRQVGVIHAGSASRSLVFSPDGRFLAGGDNRLVRLWDATTLEPWATLDIHTDVVTNVAFSPDGRILASASADGSALLWDAQPARAEARLCQALSGAQFAADWHQLATGLGPRPC